MFSEFIEKAEEQFSKELPFVLYRKPGAEEVQLLLQYNSEIYHTRTFTEMGFVFAPFDSEKAPILLQADEIHIEKYTINTKNEKAADRPHLETESARRKHLDLVQKAVQEIERKTFKKVVLSRAIEVDCDEPLFSLYEALLNAYPNAFCYVWYHPKVGLWLGATPEVLTRIKNRNLVTMSLAGTKVYLEGEKPKWEAKELEEQALVTSYISTALDGLITGMKVSETETVQAGNLWHLRTTISGTVKEKGIAKIIKALHPTPAICGLPKKSAKTFILDNEGYDRAYYTGYLGELNFKERIDRSTSRRNQEHKAYGVVRKSSELFVNLRCMELRKDKAIIYVGGGVTQASIPENEWQETIAKSKTMSKIIFN